MKGLIYAISFLAATAWQPLASLAANIQNSKDVPINLTLFVPCAGEDVDTFGTTHVALDFTLNANGATLVMHVNPQGLAGVGRLTGDTYRAVGVTQVSTTMAADGFPYEYTVVNNFRFIGPGPGNNYVLHSLQHATVNANGSMTTFIDSFSTGCK